MAHHVPIIHKSRKAPQEEEDAAKLKFGEGLYIFWFLNAFNNDILVKASNYY